MSKNHKLTTFYSKKLAINYFLIPMIFLILNCNKNYNSASNENETNNLPEVMAQEHPHWPSLANTPWPMYRHDPQLTGRGHLMGPTDGIMDTLSTVIGEINSNPVIDLKGNILYTELRSRRYSYLISFSPKGDKNWLLYLGEGESEGSPLISSDNRFYLAAEDDDEGYLLKGDLEGNIVWKYSFSTYKYGSRGSVNISKDGSMIFVCGFDSSLYAINKDGTLGWKYNISPDQSIGTPALSPDGKTVYFASKDNWLYSLSITGELLWKKSLADNIDSRSISPTVDSGGNIYIYSEDGFFSFDENGDIRWKDDKTYFTAYYPFGISIGPSGSIHAVTFGSYSIYNYNGTIKWVVKGYIGDQVTIDKNGNVYAGIFMSLGLTEPLVENKNFISFTSDGKIRYSLLAGLHHEVISPPCIIDGKLYSGNSGHINSFTFSIR